MMTVPFAGVLNAFEAECRAALLALREAGDEALDRPTPFPPFNVKELAVHLAVSVGRLPDLLEAGNGGEDRGRIDDAIQVADRFGTADMVAAFLEEGWRRTAAAAASAGGSAEITAGWDEMMTVHEYMLTRVVEAIAHGRDLAQALGVEPWTTPEALALARPAVQQVLNGEPPAELDSDADLFDYLAERRPYCRT